MKHAKFSPSAAHRWLVCPGSVKRSEGMASIQTEAAKTGTAAHWLFETNSQSTVSPEGVEISEEMRRHIQTAKAEMFKHVLGAKLFSEYHLPVWRVLQLDKLLVFGTADVVALDDDRAWVIDLKYGKHSVNPGENPQLLTYAVGLLDLVGDAYEKFSLCVLQPREGKLWRQWDITYQDVIDHRDKLIKFFSESHDTVTPGNHCFFCPAKHDCIERFFPDEN